MLPRLRYLIIAVLVFGHGLGAQIPGSQRNQSDTGAAGGARQQRGLPLPRLAGGGGTLTITADTISATIKPGEKVYVAQGDVRLELRGVRLSADRMTYDSATGTAVASGHVAFDSVSEQTHIEGTRAEYNFVKSSGEFDDFRGVSGVQMHGRTTLVSKNPLIFSGKKLQRLGPDHYRLEDGSVTSCTLPHPKWELTAATADVELGRNATLHHAVFRLFDVPVFYAPFLTHSTTATGRHSGVLIPVVSHSNTKGYVLGDSFYWATARNVNLTLGGEYLSARGWADHVSFDSFLTRSLEVSAQLDGVFDRGLLQPDGTRLRQGGQELHLFANHLSDSGFRSVVDVDYLSSYLYRLVFNNSFAAAINSEAISTGFTEKQSQGQDFAVIVHHYQNFLGTTPNTSLSLATLPEVDWNGYAQALTRRVPLYFSWDASGGLFDRSQPGFSTGVMDRLDLAPKLTLPLQTPAGNITGDVSVRSRYYSEQQSAPSVASPNAAPSLLSTGLWSNSASADVEWRPPALERAFANPSGVFGARLEHVFEPQVGFHYTGGVDQADQIIRFDAADTLANTRELEYGFTNRLLAAGAKPGQSRELISWTLLQKYYFNPTFSGALIPGERNVFLTTELLSPFDVEALPLRFSPLSSVVRVSPFTLFDGEWRLDYDSHDHQVIASAFSGNFHFGKKYFFSGSHYLLRPPPGLAAQVQASSFNQLHFSTGYGNPTAPGYSMAAGIAYDASSGKLQYSSVQLTRNWDCLGFSIEYRRFSLASVRRENQFFFSLTLANVGSFGNLK